MQLHALSSVLIALAAISPAVQAAYRPPLGPVKGVSGAAQNAFTEDLLGRCDVHDHDTVLDHFNWVSWGCLACAGAQWPLVRSTVAVDNLLHVWAQNEPDGGKYSFR